jgi:hypothetical protein
MSRYYDYEGEEEFPGQAALQQANWDRALKGKNGRRFLALLREALMALPEHRLIEGALCTVGAGERRARIVAEEDAAAAEHNRKRHQWYAANPRYGTEPAEPIMPDYELADALAAKTDEQGEGVCANGALMWYLNVQGGMDSAEAFAALPMLLDADRDTDQLHETAILAAAADGKVATSVAWDVAFANDEWFKAKTPEERWEAMIEWIDRKLAA